MSDWKYIDATNAVAFRVLPDGGMESCLASELPPDTAAIQPAEETYVTAPTDISPVDDAVAKLVAFLRANPDVVSLINEGEEP